MIKRTRWSPDTCDCVIDYEWDTDAPLGERVHTAVASTPCHLHRTLPDHVAIHAAVMAENVGKNRLIRKVADVTGVDPTAVAWVFDDERRLIVDVPGGLSPEHRAELAKGKG
jgi:hypothetical protein